MKVSQLFLIYFSFFNQINSFKQQKIKEIKEFKEDSNNFSFIPLVYVYFGDTLPLYLTLMIEITLRNNYVVLISPINPNITHISFQYISLSLFQKSINIFTPLYRHYAMDGSPKRAKYELACFLRWFILRDYMNMFNISYSMFNDGDVAVFRNVSQFETNACDAKLIVTAPGKLENVDYHHSWVSGHSSFWTPNGINDFTDFLLKVYQQLPKYVSHIELMRGHRRGISDMTILWWWWISHIPTNELLGWKHGWALNGIRYNDEIQKNNLNQSITSQPIDQIVAYVRKAIKFPIYNQTKLNLCNGLNIVDNTVYDHMWAFCQGVSFHYNHNIPSNLHKGKYSLPYIKGLALLTGGAPEFLHNQNSQSSLKEKLQELKSLKNSEYVYFNSIHYQGGSKSYAFEDLCPYLYLTGSKIIEFKVNQDNCEKFHPKNTNLDQRDKSECTKRRECNDFFVPTRGVCND